MSAAVERFVLCVLCVLSAPRVEGRRSHRNGGAFESERFIFREQCALKEEPGPCKALKPRYYFNIDSGSCEMFDYGGCKGNDNNFLTKEECEETCVVSEDKDPCQLPEAPGPCRGLVSRFLFDPETQSCRHFFYGGCFGNANNFRTIDECKNKCQSTDKMEQTSPPPRAEQEDVTHGPNAPSTLETTAVTEKVSVDGQAQPLVQFHNKTKEHYSKDVDVSEDCLLAVDRGSCDEPQRRYFYNSTSGRCQIFKFSGCGGNANNFLHRRHCIKKCVHRAKDHRGRMGEKMIRIRRKNLEKFRHVSA
ncbi:hypothetical protein NQD34_015286 [Periophthalmus magnuspinnatus]|nr:hypothetical protein NQD34_015286 [Periophthalmus magnuspinnatus]